MSRFDRVYGKLADLTRKGELTWVQRAESFHCQWRDWVLVFAKGRLTVQQGSSSAPRVFRGGYVFPKTDAAAALHRVLLSGSGVPAWVESFLGEIVSPSTGVPDAPA
jgi:hypothetical protein